MYILAVDHLSKDKRCVEKRLARKQPLPWPFLNKKDKIDRKDYLHQSREEKGGGGDKRRRIYIYRADESRH